MDYPLCWDYHYVNNSCKGGIVIRKTYLDNIKWITVVIVVIYHVIFMFNAVESATGIGPWKDIQYQDGFQYVVYPWMMLLLFVVSGMTSRFYLNKHTNKEFIKSRTTKLLVPSTLGVLAFGWAMGYYNTLIAGAEGLSDLPAPIRFLILCVSGIGVLWYIQVLWVLSVVLVLVRKLEKDRLYKICSKANMPVLLALTLAIWGAAQILNTPVIVVYRFGIYGLGFFLGYFVFSHEEVMARLGKCWLPLVIAAAALCVGFTIVFWQAPYANHVVLDTYFCNLYAWIAVLAILAFMYRFGNFETPVTKWLSKHSWGLYLFHYLTLSMAAWYLRLYVPDMAPVLVYILVGIAAFGGGYLVYAIMSRIPVIRWLVCGIKGGRNVQG